jgi:hypothetical protein
MGSRFAVGIPCVAASPVERDHGLDVVAKIGRQAPGFAEEIVQLDFKDGGDTLDEIVARRVFLFALDAAPIGRRNAQALNKEGVAGPDGKAWGPSTIYGNWRRGTGILNNELYVGVLVWNRQRFVKDPTTGKRQARLNPPEAWIRERVPELRIIDEALGKRPANAPLAVRRGPSPWPRASAHRGLPRRGRGRSRRGRA